MQSLYKCKNIRSNDSQLLTLKVDAYYISRQTFITKEKMTL